MSPAWWAVTALAGLVIFFLVLPSFVVMERLAARKNPADFDIRPEVMDGTPYETYRERILEDFAWMRAQAGERVSLRTEDGLLLQGTWYPGGRKTAILVHGYRSTPLNNFCTIARTLLEDGWSLLMPWERAHGESGGNTTLMGQMEQKDLHAWAEWADARTGGAPMVLYGMSMGGAAVAYAQETPFPECVRACVADSAYRTIFDVMLAAGGWKTVLWRMMWPFMRVYARWKWKVRLGMDTRDALAGAKMPVLLIGGEKDTTVPPERIREVWEACRAPKKLILVPGAAHTLAFTAGGDAVRSEILGWMNERVLYNL